MSTQAVDLRPIPGKGPREAKREDAEPKVEREASKAPAGDSPVIHEYDGIQECDNHLPRWWLITLYGTIVFAVGYWLHFHTFGSGKNPMAEYQEQESARLAAEAEKMKAAGAVTPELLVKLSKDPATAKQGKEVFTQNCASCHGPEGAGLIGPNLTDDSWLHGGKPDAIYTTVRDGFLAKGMPAWGPQLGEERVRAVAAYLLTIKNTNLQGKAPQGEKEL